MRTFQVEVLVHQGAACLQRVAALQADPMGWSCFHGIEAVRVASVLGIHRIVEEEVQAADHKAQVA